MWLTALLLSRLALYRISMRFQRASAQQRAANRYWPLIATGCAVIAALLWGMAGFAFMAPQNAFAETMLHLVLVTVVFLAVPNLANYYPTVVAYATGVFMPLAARNFMIGGEFHVLLGALRLLASVYVMLNGKSQARAIAAALSQQRVNSELVQALRRENDAVNAARTAAESANASKSRFFAAANHDLRQPLHAIGLLAYTLRTQGSKAEVQTISTTRASSLFMFAPEPGAAPPVLARSVACTSAGSNL
jgi:two-component system, sensor histidine kinase